MNRVRRLWRGEVPLIVAFWDWAAIGGLLVNVSFTAVSLVLFMHDEIVAGLIAGHIVSIPYNVLVTVGVWRSAARYRGDRRWARLARVATVIGMGLASLA